MMMTTEQKLAVFFDKIWQDFINHESIDVFTLQEYLDDSGLTEWIPAGKFEADLFELEEGEPCIYLNDEGKQVQQMAKEYRNENDE